MSNFRYPRYGFLGGAPRGANPVAPPLQNPNAPMPGGGGSLWTSSSKLVDGAPKLLAKLQYDTPRPCGAYITAPLVSFPDSTSPIIASTDVAPVELWILGKCTIGIGGTTYSYEFDIPAGQVVQIQHVAQYLEISARLIAMPIPTTPGGAAPHAMLQDFLFPPVYGGRSSTEVFVLAEAGEGYVGLSNATRRARFPKYNSGHAAECQPPPFASQVQILTKSDSTFQWVVSGKAASGGGCTLGPALVPANMCCKVPVPDGAEVLQVIQGGITEIGLELIWRLGFSGVEA